MRFRKLLLYKVFLKYFLFAILIELTFWGHFCFFVSHLRQIPFAFPPFFSVYVDFIFSLCLYFTSRKIWELIQHFDRIILRGKELTASWRGWAQKGAGRLCSAEGLRDVRDYPFSSRRKTFSSMDAFN